MAEGSYYRGTKPELQGVSMAKVGGLETQKRTYLQTRSGIGRTMKIGCKVAIGTLRGKVVVDQWERLGKGSCGKHAITRESKVSRTIEEGRDGGIIMLMAETLGGEVIKA